MISTVSKKTAYPIFIKKFGPQKKWNTYVHISYGFVVGIPYTKMVQFSNDCLSSWDVAQILWKMNFFKEFPYEKISNLDGSFKTYLSVPSPIISYITKMMIWNRKPIRKKNDRQALSQ